MGETAPVTKLGMSLQGGAWRWQKEECSKRDAEIQMEVVGSSLDGKKTPLLSSQEGSVSLQWQEGENPSVTAPSVKSQAQYLLQRDGQMGQGLRRVEVTGGYTEKGHCPAHWYI